MGVEETALEQIRLAYDAALAPEKWQEFMVQFIKAMGAHSAFLRATDHNAGRVNLFEAVGYDSSLMTAYREHFVHIDHFAPILVSLPVGTFMRGDEAVPWEQQRNTEFYNDYALAQGVRHVMGGTLAKNDRYHLLFALQREVGRCDFDEEDMRLVRLVAPHMRQALQIHRQMADVTAQKQWALSALDHLRVGVILLDERGKPIHLNRAAELLANGRNGFLANRDGLTLSSPTETTRLRCLIADAALSATGRGTAGGGCLRTADNGVAALQFQVFPLSRDLSEQPWMGSLPGGCVAIFVSANGGSRLPWRRVAAMHGLTGAEARLASLLADGSNLEEAAKTLSVSIQTVRSQLKSVFAKTGVTRQAELVSLLLGDMLTDSADGQSKPAHE